MTTQLKNAAGEYVTIQSGESCNLTGTLKSTEGATITSIATLTLTLYDSATGAIINSRNAQNVNGVNGGSFTSGNYVIELDSADTTAVGDIADNSSQVRVARIEFTYSDGDTTRKGIEQFSFKVEKMKTAIGVGSGSNEITLTVTNSSSNPVAEASVYVTTDIAGQNVVAGPVLTDVAGVTPTLNLDAGTYFSWSEHADYTFTNPQTFTVS
jgi:hypothetical protein